jgi:hypothetical protein
VATYAVCSAWAAVRGRDRGRVWGAEWSSCLTPHISPELSIELSMPPSSRTGLNVPTGDGTRGGKRCGVDAGKLVAATGREGLDTLTLLRGCLFTSV